MLVLTRKIGESIFINDNVEIVVLCIDAAHDRNRSATVRIGIVAPREVPVFRGEIHRLRQAAAKAEPDSPSRFA